MWGCAIAVLGAWLIVAAFAVAVIHAAEHITVNGPAFGVGLAIIGLAVFVILSREGDR